MHNRWRWIGVIGVLVLAIGAGYGANEMEARRRLHDNVGSLTGGGDPKSGGVAIAAHGCGDCHQIPGIRGANGKVGPPLAGFAGRAYIAGRLSNSPDHLIGWVLDPYAVDPKTVMPPSGLTPQEARDVAAYLYTLR